MRRQRKAEVVILEFMGVDLMREDHKRHGKTDSCYVTEVNGNPGTGIIDVTGVNHFVNLVQLIEHKTDQDAQPVSATAPPSQNQPVDQPESEAFLSYRILATRVSRGEKLNLQQYAMYTLYKVQFGPITA